MTEQCLILEKALSTEEIRIAAEDMRKADNDVALNVLGYIVLGACILLTATIPWCLPWTLDWLGKKKQADVCAQCGGGIRK